MKDDFLKQFQEQPSEEFGQSLLATLRQLDAEEAEIPDTTKTPLVLLPPRRRSRDRYLSWIASLALLFFFSSVLLLNFSDEEIPNSAQSLNIARITGLSQLAWSPDGRLLYVSDDSRMYRLNLRLQVVDSWPLALDGSVTTMQFVGDDYLLLGDTAGNLSLWYTETMQKLESHSLHDGALEVLAYLPNRQLILTSGADGEMVSLSLRGSQISEISRLSLGTAMQIRGLAVHPDEQQLIATSSNAVTLAYAIREDGSLAASSAYAMSSFPPTSQAEYRMNGQFMTLLWWDTVSVVDSHTLAERYHYSLPEPYLWLSPLQSQHNRLLLANPNGIMGIWDFASESYLEIYRGSTEHPLQAAFHPEGQLIGAITSANEIRLWRIENLGDGSISASEVAVNRPSSNQSMTDAPLVLAPIEDDFSQIRELYHFGDGYLLETLWSPDGSLLMLSSTSTIRLYDADLNFLREWSVLGMDLTVTIFSPDGRYLLTGSSTGTLAAWDVLTGRNITSLLVQDEPIVFLAFLNGGSRILSRDASGEFVLLNFDGSQLSVRTRSEQAALASWTIQDWQVDGDSLQLLMARPSPRDFSTNELINLIELSLGESITAEAASTGLTGHIARFVSQGRILIYEEREHRLHLYTTEGMAWQDTLALPFDIATLNSLSYDAADNQVFLIDFDRSLSVFNLETSEVKTFRNASALLVRPTHTLALHPSGNRAAVITSYNRIALWQFGEMTVQEIANDSPVLGQIRSFVLGSGNIAAASTSEGSVLLFDSITGNLLRRLDLATWGVVNHDLLFNSDNSLLAVLGQDRTGVDSILSLIDVQAAINGEQYYLRASQTFDNEYLAGMAFNTAGDGLITGGATVREWSIGDEQGEFQTLYLNNLRGLTIFAHHPRLNEVATLRPGNYLLVLETMNMENRYLLRLYGRSLPANTFLEYSQDGEQIMLVGNGSVPRIFDSETGELLATVDINVTRFNSLALSEDYLYLAAEAGIYVINIEEILRNPDEYLILPYDATQIAVSADGKRLFYLGRDGMVRVLGLPAD